MKNLVMISMTRSGHNFIKNNLMSYKKYDRYLNLETINPNLFEKNIKKHKIVGKCENIIVIRDLLNWLSSYLKIQLNTKKDIQQVRDYIKIWGLINQEAFNETNFIPNKIVISYEKFKLEKKYREEICKKINGFYNEKKINLVPKNGQYSSFDSDKFQNKGSKMETENRYKYFINSEHEELYIKFLKEHPEVVHTYKNNNFIDIDKQKILDKYNL